MTKNPSVSVVIPCRNEERFIGTCLDSILAMDHPEGGVEILVVDGMSRDTTRDLVRNRAEQDPSIRLLDNTIGIVPTALNIGIAEARGGIVMRMDAHAKYPKTYIADCIRLLETSGAANAGGCVVTVPGGDGPWAVPVARVTSHRFGVGNSAFRTSATPGFVDTVPFGTFRKELFETVGRFDERLTRNQDNEFNARIRRHGYKIAFDPAIKTTYYNQATLKGLVFQGFFTGMWNVYTLRLHPHSWQWRRFIPAAFVAYLASIPFAFIFAPSVASLNLAPLGVYLSLCLGFSALEWRTAATFFLYHVSYGSGTWFGMLALLTGTWKRWLGRPLRP